MISDREWNGALAGWPIGGALAVARGGPTAPRMALGAQLRRLREASHVTSREAAEAIRATPSKLSRLERGRCGVKQRDVADLLTLYAVTDEAEREALLALARQANEPGWWRQYHDVLPRWSELYVGLEDAASGIRAYDAQFVHVLMQTEDYARAVILPPGTRVPPEEIDRRINLRIKRQQLLTRPGAPEMWAVLDETALRRSPGGPRVMRAQLEHLLQLTSLPNVTLQIMPFSAGPPAAVGGPFTILRFPEPNLPDLVYLEQLSSALYLDQPDDVADYLAVMDQLCVQAETSAASQDMLRAFLRQA